MNELLQGLMPVFMLWGGVLMALGYGLSCLSRVLAPEPASPFAEPPFVARRCRRRPIMR